MSYPAGWYLDPSDPTGQTQRFFDGVNWTEHAATAAQSAGAASGTGYAGAPGGEPTPARASMNSGRAVLTAGIALIVALRLVRLFQEEDVSTGLYIIGGTLAVVGGGVFLWYRKRREHGGKQATAARAAGLLTGATFVTYVQQQPGGGQALNPLAGMKKSFYKSLASGLLAVYPDGLRFLPGEKAVANGHQPWFLPWHLVEAVQETKAPVGGWLYIGPYRAEAIELAATSMKKGEFAAACAAFGARVL